MYVLINNTYNFETTCFHSFINIIDVFSFLKQRVGDYYFRTFINVQYEKYQRLLVK